MPVAPYAFEVWSPANGGTFIADISELATSRKMTAGRNRGGGWSLSVDTHQLNLLAATYDTDAAGLLNEGINELRVRRGNIYLRQGGRIDYAKHKYQASEAGLQTDIEVTGFLDILAQRFYEKTKSFNGVQVSDILWTVINEMQTASTNYWEAPVPTADRATFGITRGNNPTIGTKIRNYEAGKSVKDILVQMTELSTTNTDVEIDYAKVFNVYERMGADKPQVVFELGRNIIDYEVPRDAKSITNRVISYGAGTGEAARVQAIVQDTASQTPYKVRQYIQQLNSVQEVDTLEDHGTGYLAATKLPISIPSITVDLNVDFTILDFWVGDKVTVRLITEDLPVPIEGLFKVENIELNIADEGAETAKLVLS